MNKVYFYHGTAVLGTVLMVDNTIGGIGICPNAKGRVVSQYQTSGFSTSAAIAKAITLCSAGDFILIEAQEYDPASGTGKWPVEIAAANMQMIRLAIARNITIIEPAGNGSHNLDQYRTPDGKFIFNRASPDFHDSGAIMVGSASSGSVHTRRPLSNYGSRIDLFAWGVDVVTTWTNDAGTDSEYTKTFSGTSSASAIVAGAAVNLQGAVKAGLGSVWKPGMIRATLKNGGTGSSNPAGDLIGVMPNLKAIMGVVLPEIAGTATTQNAVSKVGKGTSDAPITVTEEEFQF